MGKNFKLSVLKTPNTGIAYLLEEFFFNCKSKCQNTIQAPDSPANSD